MKTNHSVRQRLFSVLLLALLLTCSGAATPGDPLPGIEARSFDLTPLEISRSGRIYRFKVQEEPPKTGSIVLVKADQKPVMAFRVLQTDGSKQEMIAKRVRRYESEGSLQLNQSYRGAEKLAELVPAPPNGASPPPPDAAPPPTAEPVATPTPEPEATPTPEPEATPTPEPEATPAPEPEASPAPTPEETPKESPVDAYDEELDASIPPEPEEEQFRTPTPAIEEKESLIRYPRTLGVSVGSFRNMSNFQWPGNTANGFTAYFNTVVDQGVWFRGQGPEDSFSIEFGAGYYSFMNLTGLFDSYDVLPIRSEILYSVQLNSDFAVLGYLGAQYNWMISSTAGNTIGESALSGFQPTAGLGVLYQIGPQWYVRADLGIDRMALGLAVKW